MKILHKINSLLSMFILFIVLSMFWYASGQPNISDFIRVSIAEQEEKPISIIRKDLTSEEYLRMANFLIENGKFQLAHLYLDEALKKDKNKDKIYLTRGRLYFLNKQYEEVVEVLDKITDNTEETTTLKTRSLIKLKEFKKALETNIQYNSWEKAVLLLYFNQEDQAEHVLKKINTEEANKIIKILKDNKNIKDLNNNQKILSIAKSLYDNGEYEISGDQAMSVIKKEPTYKDAWYLFGLSSLSTGQYQGAYQALTETLFQDPSDINVRIALAHTCIWLKKIDEANRHINIIEEVGKIKEAEELKNKLKNLTL